MSKLQPLLFFALALAIVLWLRSEALFYGSLAVELRALVVAPAFVFALLGLRPFLSPYLRSTAAFFGIFLAPTVFFVLLYFFLLLPQREGEGVRAEQLLSSLITDASSNGIVEIGFSNPIYTPTIEFENAELFTRQVEVFLRLRRANDEVSLYRAVREDIPGTALSLESSVKGLLSENEGYLFNPVGVAPLSKRRGRIVFVISDQEDGRAFSTTLKDALAAQFELRVPETGELLYELPLIAL